MVIVIADETGKALREIVDYSLEVAFGEDENKITLTADADVMPPENGYAYIEGTEYGGTIDQITSGTTTETLSASGRSWHGVLAGKRLVPDSGKSHITVSGQIATVLQSLINRMGLNDLFEAPASESDTVSISSYQFERFVDGYTGIKAMLTANGLKLKMRCAEGKVLIGARAVVDYGSKVDSDLLDFDLTKITRRTNHLVCGGTGENENRAVVHFYADKNGKVSKTQSLFGVDEIAAFYDYSNADEDKLEEEGKKKLEELQGDGTVDVDVDEDIDVDIGDVVSARNNKANKVVSATITKKIVKVSNGITSYEYEAGTPSSGTSASTISGSAESTNGGHAYYAGNGLTLDNYTFDADVNASDLQAVNNTASNALTQASSALSNASSAQQTADAAVATISASSPINASRDENAVSLSHASSGVSAGAYGPTSNVTADWGDTLTVGARISVNATGHLTSAQGRTVTLPSNTATSEAKGLMSASDKAKLDVVEEGANKTTVDSALSDTSTNPVQNKVVKGALDDKANSEHNHSASNITSGYLPISRGGLGGGTATASLFNLIANSVQEFTGTDISNIYVALVDGDGNSTNPILKAVTPANFAAGIATLITPDDIGALSKTGNAVSASKLQDKRTIALTGAVNGSAEFDGSGDITITTTGDSEAASFLAAHPVGAIYQTTVSDNPGTLYGGTWQALPSIEGFMWERTA